MQSVKKTNVFNVLLLPTGSSLVPAAAAGEGMSGREELCWKSLLGMLRITGS